MTLRLRKGLKGLNLEDLERTGDKNDPFSTLPEKVLTRLLRMLDVFALARLRSTNTYLNKWASKGLTSAWIELLEKSFPLRFRIERLLQLGSGQAGQENMQALYMRAVLSDFQNKPEALDPFNVAGVHILYRHYAERLTSGLMACNLHNYTVLVAMWCKVRYGAYVEGMVGAREVVESVVSQRYGQEDRGGKKDKKDRRGVLVRGVLAQWGALVANPDKLIVSERLREFVGKADSRHFLKLQFLMFVSRLPHFPARVYEVQWLVNRKKTRDLLLTILHDSVVFIDDRSEKNLEAIPLSQLKRWGVSSKYPIFHLVLSSSNSAAPSERRSFVSPDCHSIVTELKEKVNDLALKQADPGEVFAKDMKSICTYLEEFLSTAVAKNRETNEAPLAAPQRKKLRKLISHLASICEQYHRTLLLSSELSELRACLLLVRSSEGLYKAMHKVGTGHSDVQTTVELAKSVKAMGKAVSACLGTQRVFEKRLDRAIKTAEAQF